MAGMGSAGFSGARQPWRKFGKSRGPSKRNIVENVISEATPAEQRKPHQQLRLFLIHHTGALEKIYLDQKLINNLKGAFRRKKKPLTSKEKISKLARLVEAEGRQAQRYRELVDEMELILKKAARASNFGPRTSLERQISSYEMHAQALEKSMEHHEGQIGELIKAERRDKRRMRAFGEFITSDRHDESRRRN